MCDLIAKCKIHIREKEQSVESTSAVASNSIRNESYELKLPTVQHPFTQQLYVILSFPLSLFAASVDARCSSLSPSLMLSLLLTSLLFLGPFADNDDGIDDDGYVCVPCQFCALPSILVHTFIRDSVSARVCTNLICLCDRFEIRSITMRSSTHRYTYT